MRQTIKWKGLCENKGICLAPEYKLCGRSNLLILQSLYRFELAKKETNLFWKSWLNSRYNMFLSDKVFETFKINFWACKGFRQYFKFCQGVPLENFIFHRVSQTKFFWEILFSAVTISLRPLLKEPWKLDKKC